MSHDYLIISPCFNENETVIKFLESVDQVIKNIDSSFLIIIVNDASTDNTLELLKNFKSTAENSNLTILDLEYNVGHQDAIYQGLRYASGLDFNYAIVMDSDGEDDPDIISDLVKIENKDIIHVARKGRKEGILFKTLYYFYRALFYSFTGKKLNFGNYSLISKKVVNAIAKTSFIQYPAHLLKFKIPNRLIIYADRNKRYAGRSKMKISSLLHHAFKSFVEFSENILMVFLRIFVLVSVVLVGFLIYIFYSKYIALTAIPGWASTLSIGLVNTALICFGFFVLGIMQLNYNNRNNFQSNNSIFEIGDD
ncbi:MAG: hypothetical protein DRI54_07160 [Bacteroidetes bacterium]|nr:MAG: hypothetical protein DRI54_07160 [Bacteroidota bacterium]